MQRHKPSLNLLLVLKSELLLRASERKREENIINKLFPSPHPSTWNWEIFYAFQQQTNNKNFFGAQEKIAQVWVMEKLYENCIFAV